MTTVEWFTPGEPAPKGSAKAFGWKSKDGRSGISITNASKKAKPWASSITYSAKEAMKTLSPMTGAMKVEIMFYMKRPKSHLRSNGELKPNAPVYSTTTPDVDKLLRCAIDALTNVCFADDSQIAICLGVKEYANDGKVGARFYVEEICS